MSRRAILLLAMMAATLLASAGIVLAQGSDRAKGSSSASGQPAESDVIPGRYIVVLEDEDRGRTSAEARSDKQQVQKVASDLSGENEAESVSQTYGAALKGFAAEIPAGRLGAVRSDPRVAFVAEDRGVHLSAQTLPTGVNRVDADASSVDSGDGSGPVDADIAILDSGIYTGHPDLTVAGGKDCSRDGKNTFSDDNAGTAATLPGAPPPRTTRPGSRARACGPSRCSRPTARAAGPTLSAASTGSPRTPASSRRPT